MSAAETALASVETPVVETPDVSTENVPRGTSEQTTEQTPEKTDARRAPDALRKFLKQVEDQALKSGDQTLAQEAKNHLAQIRQGLGQRDGYREMFPSVQEARSAKALFDSVGGIKGVEELQNAKAQIERVDQLLAEGNPEVLDALFADDTKEGMTKLVSPILDKLAQQNPQAYQQAISPHAVRMMQNEGLPGAINALVDAFNGKNEAGQRQILGQLVKWFNDLSQGVQQNVKQNDPERQKFEEERTRFQKERHDAAVGEVFNSNLTYAADKIDEALKPYLPKLGLDKEGIEDLRQLIWKAYETQRKDDTTFKLAMNRNYQEGKGFRDPVEAKKFLNGHVDANLKGIVDERVERLYGKLLKAAPKPNPTAPAKPVTPVQRTSQPVKKNSLDSRLSAILAR